jgi:hypothetical protein
MKDIRQLKDGDIDLTRGIVISESSNQHVRDILITAAGELKHAPVSAIDISSFINDDEPEELIIHAKRKLIEDGYKADSIYIYDGKLKIEGCYEED